MRPGVAKLVLAVAITATSAGIFNPSSGGAASSDTIRIGIGMAGVEIGMTRGEVRGVLGPPRRVESKFFAFGPGKLVRYRYGGLDVLFWKGAPRTPSGSVGPDRRLRVASTTTTRSRRRLHTRQGIGVGSTESQVRDGLHGERCQTLDRQGQPVPRGTRNCHIGSYRCQTPPWALGDLPCRVSAFILNREGGRVNRVTVGWLSAADGTFW